MVAAALTVAAQQVNAAAAARWALYPPARDTGDETDASDGGIDGESEDGIGLAYSDCESDSSSDDDDDSSAVATGVYSPARERGTSPASGANGPSCEARPSRASFLALASALGVAVSATLPGTPATTATPADCSAPRTRTRSGGGTAARSPAPSADIRHAIAAHDAILASSEAADVAGRSAEHAAAPPSGADPSLTALVGASPFGRDLSALLSFSACMARVRLCSACGQCSGFTERTPPGKLSRPVLTCNRPGCGAKVTPCRLCEHGMAVNPQEWCSLCQRPRDDAWARSAGATARGCGGLCWPQPLPAGNAGQCAAGSAATTDLSASVSPNIATFPRAGDTGADAAKASIQPPSGALDLSARATSDATPVLGPAAPQVGATAAASAAAAAAAAASPASGGWALFDGLGREFASTSTRIRGFDYSSLASLSNTRRGAQRALRGKLTPADKAARHLAKEEAKRAQRAAAIGGKGRPVVPLKRADEGGHTDTAAGSSEPAELFPGGSATGIDSAAVEARTGASSIPMARRGSVAAAVAGAPTGVSGLSAQQTALPAARRSSSAAAAVAPLWGGAGGGAESGGSGVLGAVRGWATGFFPSPASPAPASGFQAAGSLGGCPRAGSVAAALGKDDGALVRAPEAPACIAATCGGAVAVDSR
jgi:hypothetical protein